MPRFCLVFRAKKERKILACPYLLSLNLGVDRQGKCYLPNVCNVAGICQNMSKYENSPSWCKEGNFLYYHCAISLQVAAGRLRSRAIRNGLFVVFQSCSLFLINKLFWSWWKFFEVNFSRICRKSEVPYASWLKCEKRQVEIVLLKPRESYLKLYRGTSKGCKKTSLWITHKLRQFRKRKRGRGWRFGSWIKLFSLFSVSKLEQQHFIQSQVTPSSSHSWWSLHVTVDFGPTVREGISFYYFFNFDRIRFKSDYILMGQQKA